MRNFPYITVGKILEELKGEGFPITRVTFYRLEERLVFPQTRTTSGIIKWRVYTRTEANLVKNKIKKEYALHK